MQTTHTRYRRGNFHPWNKRYGGNYPDHISVFCRNPLESTWASSEEEIYLKDIVERKKIKREDVLSAALDLLCSSVGSLTNPNSIANSLNSRQKLSGENMAAANTVRSYIGYLADAYLFEECRRYDVKGRNYFDYPNKYLLR
jgi:predicted AAA+ superfamily ATPase